MIGNLGWTEMFFIVAFALIVFGPRKLPEIAKVLGHSLAQLRRASDEFKRTWENEIDRESVKEQQQAQQKLADSAAETAAKLESASAEEAASSNSFGNFTANAESSQSVDNQPARIA